MEQKTQQTLFDFIEKDGGAGKEGDAVLQLAKLEQRCSACSLCALRSGCRQVIFGEGNPRARLMLVGEGPGAEEDRQGKPFVGAAGKLLDRILEAAELKRESLYIANVVKCRPPGNRTPGAEEVAQCLLHLKEQIHLIDPPLIVCLGALATRTLIDRKESLTRLRGRWYRVGERLYMPTFHPAALLRDSSKKRPVWDDFKEIARCYQQIMSGG